MSSAPPAASPDRPNVLITSAARKVLLVRAFGAALAGLGGGRVLAADLSPWAVALLEADGVVTLPRSDDAAFGDALEGACAGDRVGLVVPTRDDELPVMAALRDRLAMAGTVILVSSEDAVAACRDKLRFAEAVTAAGFECPRTVRSPVREFPVFVKPRVGAGGRGAGIVASPEALTRACDAILADGGEPLVQEVVEGTEFTVDVFIDREGRPISCVPRERVVVVAGESVVSRTVRDDDLSDATMRLCSALELTGHLTVQTFRAPDRIVFVEINPRYGGAASLGFAAGAPTPEYAIRSARGERQEPRLGQYEVDLVMLRYADDRFVHGTPGAGR
jgi:carbamoyl-phosphate synthase large subunit